MNSETINNFLQDVNYRHVYSYRRELKKKLVEYKGGKCECCGYNKCITALEFHHKNPDEKDFTISHFSVLSYDKCKTEVDKCMLVCCDCHREIHEREYIKKETEMKKNEEKVYAEIMNNRHKYNVKRISNSYKHLSNTDIFLDMENKMPREEIFKKYHINNKTFNKFLQENNMVYSFKKTVTNKPTKEELSELLKTNSKSAIGRMFGVSCEAVIKWCKKYGIQK